MFSCNRIFFVKGIFQNIIIKVKIVCESVEKVNYDVIIYEIFIMERFCVNRMFYLRVYYYECSNGFDYFFKKIKN